MTELPPLGICRCGCGLPTAPASKTCTSRGIRRGDLQPYRKGHGAHALRTGPRPPRERSPAEVQRNRELQVQRDQIKRRRQRLERMERDRRKAEREAIQAIGKDAAACIALCRAERAASERRNGAKRAAELASVKAALERANAERKDSQKGGRPRRIVMNVRRNPDALLAIPLWQGER